MARLLTTALLALLIATAPGLSVAEETVSGAVPSRIVAMEWGEVETLLALGVTPVGAADARGYREWVEAPELPEEVAEVGSRQEPNLEEIARLEPDLILSHAHLQPLEEKLAAIAPVEAVTLSGTGEDAYETAVAGTRRIAAITGKNDEAEALVKETEAAFEADARRIETAGLSGQPVYFVRIIGPNALRVHGETSIANTVLDRLGLTNAFTGEVSEWGFATVEPSQLADNGEATILVAGPVSDEEMAAVFDTPLGKALPAARAGRVHRLPVVWTFGGLPSAKRMADAITAAMVGAEH